MAVAIIGYYLVIGGNSGGRQAIAASVIDRLTIVPLVLIPLAIAGVFPRFLIAVLIVDVTLATSTWVLSPPRGCCISACSNRRPCGLTELANPIADICKWLLRVATS
jgi:hypothetical protein